MHSISLITMAAISLAAAPALAQQASPVGDRDPNAVDVAKTPMTDLNIDKEEIPELLIRAQQRPYDLAGLEKCRELVVAVEQFDTVLGADLDLPQDAREGLDAGRVGRAVVGSFIPFRGLIREMSGANDHQRHVRAAVQAGLARRGFLKGVGHSRGCKYPARPASQADVARWMADTQAQEQAEKDPPKEDRRDKRKDSKDGVEFVSQPVVQKLD